MDAFPHRSSRLPLTPECLVRAVKHLPSAPKVLPRLKRLLRDGNSALSDVVTLVRLDPGLAMRALQVANSPYFFTGARCHTIEEAICRVGFNEIYSLMSYAVAAQVLNRPLAAYGMESDQLWAHSVACALAAEELAQRSGIDRALGYTIGLLHGVGLVAIDEWALHTGSDVTLVWSGFPMEATESEGVELGFTNAEAGAALLRFWEFPAEIIEPVRFQYEPWRASDHGRLAALLLASKWVRAAVLATVPGRHPPLPSQSQLQALGISRGVLSSLVPAISDHFSRVRTVLEDTTDPVIQCGLFPRQSWNNPV